MKRVYLDFNAWVSMANAAIGKPERPTHTAALEVARDGVDHGLAEFSISDITYVELLQRKTG